MSSYSQQAKRVWLLIKCSSKEVKALIQLLKAFQYLGSLSEEQDYLDFPTMIIKTKMRKVGGQKGIQDEQEHPPKNSDHSSKI